MALTNGSRFAHEHVNARSLSLILVLLPYLPPTATERESRFMWKRSKCGELGGGGGQRRGWGPEAGVREDAGVEAGMEAGPGEEAGVEAGVASKSKHGKAEHRKARQ